MQEQPYNPQQAGKPRQNATEDALRSRFALHALRIAMGTARAGYSLSIRLHCIDASSAVQLYTEPYHLRKPALVRVIV